MNNSLKTDRTFDLLCIGTALVDSIIRGFDPEPVSASGFRAASGTLSVGGESVNAAMAAAKLGVRTGILCSLGKDTAGDMVLNALDKAGVDTSYVIRDEEHATPVTTMFVNADGTRKSITNAAHRWNFHPERHLDRLPVPRAVALGSLFRAPFNDPDVILGVIAGYKAKGTMILADTKLPNFRRLSLSDITDSLPFIDYIFPNEDEAAYYTGETSPDRAAEVFLSFGIRNVIIKLGAKGCFFRNASERIYLPAVPISAVDATGAGDNFLAGFAVKILEGAAHGEALRLGNACGALCASAAGASAGLKNREQAEELLCAQMS